MLAQFFGTSFLALLGRFSLSRGISRARTDRISTILDIERDVRLCSSNGVYIYYDPVAFNYVRI